MTGQFIYLLYIFISYNIFPCIRVLTRAHGGAGAVELANAVVEACSATRTDESSSFRFLYPCEASIKVSITRPYTYTVHLKRRYCVTALHKFVFFVYAQTLQSIENICVSNRSLDDKRIYALIVGVGNERRTLIGPWGYQNIGSTRYSSYYLENYWPCAGDSLR